MDPLRKIDKILEAVQIRVQDEIGSLLGVDFLLADAEKKPVTKAEAFEELTGKQICAKLDVVGEIEGLGGLFVGIKDAIRLGGTLIMLPASELDEVTGREEYNEEIEDSYGEIANIIAGSFTKDFEEMYPKSCRFVRKEQEVLVPIKVDLESDEPVKNEMFYRVSYSMNLEGTPMGEMVVLMPAATFGLHWGDDAESASEVSADEAGSIATATDKAADTDATAATPVAPVSPGFNVEKHKARVDKLLGVCQEKMSGELGALLGVEISLVDLKMDLVTKEDFFFEHASGKQVIAEMDVVGEREGKSFFAVSLKDAIYLGGLLIMLPPAELENVVNDEDFGEDGQDAYGEIANIVSGAYTAVFEEEYKDSLRFIRKELKQVVPMKVDPESAEPIPNVPFYLSTMSLNIDGKGFGDVHMLFPADMLELTTLKEEPAAEVDSSDSSSEPQAAQQAEGGSGVETVAKSVASEAQAAIDPSFDTEKHQKRVDRILGLCQTKMGDEVGALLGIDVRFTDIDNRIIGKEDFFFEEVSGKQVIANMDVVGEIEDKSFMSLTLKDAIRIGGTLIMLPESELQVSVDDDDFNADMEDAYGEIANIISGVYTSVFEEEYTKRIRFVKTGLQQVVPMKVEPEADDPIPDQIYYVSSMNIVLADSEYGTVHMLFPVTMLQLQGLCQKIDTLGEEGGTKKPDSIAQKKQETAASGVAAVAADDSKGPVDILLISDDEVEVVKLRDVLENSGYVVRILSFKDNVHNYIPGELKAVYLVTKEVDEQAFGVAIKVSTACSLPLIAAAPGWTRTKVIQAVKYGVRDILLTPAMPEDIAENIANNLVKLAA